eukprot:TRINITY_DN2635_c0_g1_i2.p1 TRINITY_DN2635_c0_g1~~TRINITY_DN2635_c0_g1_i2.p1  ORF type:complete len:504 (+),score=67.51 TRINITY_DN2635_c0_g1_i2:52-1563(+)
MSDGYKDCVEGQAESRPDSENHAKERRAISDGYKDCMEGQAESRPDSENHAKERETFASNASTRQTYDSNASSRQTYASNASSRQTYASNASSRQNFASNASSSTDCPSSLGGPSVGESNAGRSSGISEQRSAGLPGNSNDVSFEDRMKRWAERRDLKKRQKSGGNNLACQAKAVTKEIEVNTPKLRERSRGDASVQELLIQKGLSIDSLELIGSGNFAKVYKGVQTQDVPGGAKTQSVVAVKVMKNLRNRSGLAQDRTNILPKWLEREFKTNHAQHHENLVRVIESSLDSLPYAIVLEYCPGGSLHDSITGDPSTTLQRFTWENRLKAALDVALGMSHLHKQNIIHRDLKTQNVLLLYPVKSPGDVVVAKVCDFGLARYLPDGDYQSQLTHQVGTWYYMAPEMFDTDSKKAYDGKVDVYSYAVLLYELLAGDLHYENGQPKSFSELVVFIFGGGRPNLDKIPEGAPEVLRSLMERAWRAEPSERPAFPEIAERLREDTSTKI